MNLSALILNFPSNLKKTSTLLPVSMAAPRTVKQSSSSGSSSSGSSLPASSSIFCASGERAPHVPSARLAGIICSLRHLDQFTPGHMWPGLHDDSSAQKNFSCVRTRPSHTYLRTQPPPLSATYVIYLHVNNKSILFVNMLLFWKAEGSRNWCCCKSRKTQKNIII